MTTTTLPLPTLRYSATTLAALAATAALLTGCNSDAASATGSLTLEDGWVASTDAQMSAAYGTLTNDSDEEITITEATSPVAAEMELHEMVPDGEDGMLMQEIDGGIVLPAGGEVLLEPGGTHLMLLGLSEPLEPGTEITIDLTTDEGTTVSITIPAKDVPAGEDYHPTEDEAHGDDTVDHGDH